MRRQCPGPLLSHDLTMALMSAFHPKRNVGFRPKADVSVRLTQQRRLRSALHRAVRSEAFDTDVDREQPWSSGARGPRNRATH